MASASGEMQVREGPSQLVEVRRCPSWGLVERGLLVTQQPSFLGALSELVFLGLGGERIGMVGKWSAAGSGVLPFRIRVGLIDRRPCKLSSPSAFFCFDSEVRTGPTYVPSLLNKLFQPCGEKKHRIVRT